MKKAIREEVLKKFLGKCGYCGSPITLKDMQVDHMTSKHYASYNEGTNHKAIENLMPTCKSCNHYKRAKCIESSGYHIGYRDYMKTFHKRLGKLPKNTQSPKTIRRKEYMWIIANKYGITPDKPWGGIFYYETIKEQQ